MPRCVDVSRGVGGEVFEGVDGPSLAVAKESWRYAEQLLDGCRAMSMVRVFDLDADKVALVFARLEWDRQVNDRHVVRTFLGRAACVRGMGLQAFVGFARPVILRSARSAPGATASMAVRSRARSCRGSRPARISSAVCR